MRYFLTEKLSGIELAGVEGVVDAGGSAAIANPFRAVESAMPMRISSNNVAAPNFFVFCFIVAALFLISIPFFIF